MIKHYCGVEPKELDGMDYDRFIELLADARWLAEYEQKLLADAIAKALGGKSG